MVEILQILCWFCEVFKALLILPRFNPGFTIAGIVTMGSTLPTVVPSDFMGNGELAGQVGKMVSIWFGLWLWGLAIWFFLVSVGAHWSCVRKKTLGFAMTFYSYVFPNTALTTATFAIGRALSSRGINIVGCVMSILVVITWITVFIMMIRAVICKDILWPQKQEDRDEGGWKDDTPDLLDCNEGRRPVHQDSEVRHRATAAAASGRSDRDVVVDRRTATGDDTPLAISNSAKDETRRSNDDLV
jgi:hypothetical protein